MSRTNKLTIAMDLQIGQAIKALRVAQEMSQTALSASLGVSFQQLQKIESGKNRISASALVVICKALNISPMDILGPLVGERTETSGLAAQVASLKKQLSDIKTDVRAALK